MLIQVVISTCFDELCIFTFFIVILPKEALVALLLPEEALVAVLLPEEALVAVLLFRYTTKKTNQIFIISIRCVRWCLTSAEALLK